MSQSSEFIATTKGELVSADETQEGKNTCHLLIADIRLQPEESQDVKTQDTGSR